MGDRALNEKATPQQNKNRQFQLATERNAPRKLPASRRINAQLLEGAILLSMQPRGLLQHTA